MDDNCPTPKKHRFATMEAALIEIERAGFALNKKLYAYDTCECGWIHLTSKESRAIHNPKGARTLEQLIKLGDDEFDELVRSDVRGRAHPDESKMLRNPLLVRRWAAAMKAFQISLSVQLVQKAGQRDPEIMEWRARLAVVQKNLSDRRNEARAICSNISLRNLPTPFPEGKSSEQRELRKAAGERAIDRLIEGNREEFTQYLIEEYAELGAKIPPRILKYADQYGIRIPGQRESSDSVPDDGRAEAE
ncbi:hypothetical protein ABT282_08445 [Streptomyces sp. NPDC000927]|uniref:hypothetical protein n=1 Tax=Streptomyces sp. NPDC000927 TaxID=3154371 RepID=UPI0033233E6F